MPWTNAPQVVLHGTDEPAALNIRANGIDLKLARLAADFGPGFYVTSSRHQAQQWANKKARRSGARAAVVSFDLDRDAAAQLRDHIAFVVAGADFFDFVAYNRRGTNLDHARLSRVPYDLLYGPVAAYPSMLIYQDCDQICLRTDKALAILSPVTHITYGIPLFA